MCVAGDGWWVPGKRGAFVFARIFEHVIEGLESQVRIDGPGAVADEQGEVMHLARLAALQDQADLGARAARIR